ncbi:DoxX family protein [Streptomyces gobiensis]|uniref:DoxX family protein n=1 Tax=Streptomyces gobiensis TaxID=2875706 RepID=UPI001E40124B|nr:DoxX family protein [Streptomyces gobiensis]UGY91061.1 DoxX family protein [Streptomyces gobiensis]
MDILVLVGRILFAALFLGSAFNHLVHTSGMTAYTASRGVPAAKLATLVSGVVLLLGGLSVLLGIWADLGALLLFIFLIPTAVLMHAFWKEGGSESRQVEMIMFQKDLALAGAALMLFAFFSFAGSDLGLTITGPLFNIS